MKLLFGVELSQAYTWHGLRGKKTLKDTQISKCIFDALSAKMSEYEINAHASDWLRHFNDNNKKKPRQNSC